MFVCPLRNDFKALTSLMLNYTLLLFLYCFSISLKRLNCAFNKSHLYSYHRLPIIFRFTPNTQGVVNFNVVCKVRKKTVPLTLNVKAEGFAMSVCLICEDSAGNKIELTSTGSNRIQFGEVGIE